MAQMIPYAVVTLAAGAAPNIGPYLVIRRLGVGGMGEVFLARQRGHAGVERLAAVKVMLPDFAEDPAVRARFVEEARVAAQLTHPHIVAVFEFGEAGGAPYLAMEYVAGQHLGRVLARAQREGVQLDVGLALAIGLGLLDGLRAAHDAHDASGRPLGLVHRDVSPSNLLVGYRGDVKLMDFGIARAAGRAHASTAGVVRGKLAYMAPEQARGEPVDQRADVWAAGVVLWELLAQRPLFEGADDPTLLRQVLAADVPDLIGVRAEVPRSVGAAIMAALVRERDERCPSVAALASALRPHALADAGDRRAAIAAMMAGLFAHEAAESEQRDHLPPVVRASPAEPGGADQPTVRRPAIEASAAAPALASAGGGRRVGAAVVGAAALVALVAVVVLVARPGDRVVATAPRDPDAALAGSARTLVVTPLDSPRGADARPVDADSHLAPLVDARRPAVRPDARPRSTPVDAPARVPVDAAPSMPPPRDAPAARGKLALGDPLSGALVEYVIDGGRYQAGQTITLPAGDHAVEVIVDGRVVGRRRVMIDGGVPAACGVRAGAPWCRP
jgi:hypothetical protein